MDSTLLDRLPDEEKLKVQTTTNKTETKIENVNTTKKISSGNGNGKGSIDIARESLMEIIRILFDLKCIDRSDFNNFSKTLKEKEFKLEQIHRDLSTLQKKEIKNAPIFTTTHEMFLEMMKPIAEHRYFKILKEDLTMKDFIHTPIYMNGDINTELLGKVKSIESFMKVVLNEARGHHDIKAAWTLYSIIRTSLNEASITDSKMYALLREVNKLNRQQILSCRAEHIYKDGSDNLVPFYKLYIGPETEEVVVCSLCKKVANKDISGRYYCSGESFCSHYRDKEQPDFIKIRLNNNPLWIINDIYYEFVTLPNLFEKITLDELKKYLPEDNFTFYLYPGIDRDGDIRVVSKTSGVSYIIDCKKYKKVLNLINYEVKNLSTVIKIKKLGKDSRFMFVVPGKIAKQGVIDFVREDDNFNKRKVLIFSETEVAKYILKEEEKLRKQEV